MAELGKWGLEEGAGRGQKLRTWRDCLRVPRALTWDFGFIPQDVPGSE